MIKVKYIAISLFYAAIGVTNSFGVDFQYSDKAAAFLGSEINEPPITYKITAHIFSDSDVNQIIQNLGRRGFNLGKSQRMVGRRRFLDIGNKKWLDIDSTSSGIRYFDESLGELSETDEANSAKLKDSADKMVKELSGSESKNYCLTNTEEDLKSTPNSPPVIISKTFRYLKKVDGRLVEGTSSQLRVTFAEKFQVKAIDFRCPDISKDIGIRNKIKRSGIKRQLLQYLQSEELQKQAIGVSRFTIHEGYKSLILDTLGGEKRLTPSVSFYVTGNKVGVDSLRKEITFKEDADQAPNLLEQEIQRFIPLEKK